MNNSTDSIGVKIIHKSFNEKLEALYKIGFLDKETKELIRLRYPEIPEGDKVSFENKQCFSILDVIMAHPIIPLTSSLINKAKVQMNLSHIGMDKTKQFLLDHLRLAMITRNMPTPVLLVGQPGTGKTSLALSMAEGLGFGGRKIQLSGATGAFIFNGVDRGYRDACCGKIIKVFQEVPTLNPVIILDEVDKLGTSEHNGRAADALLDILDTKQSRRFVDNYLDVPFNVSKAFYVLTANTLSDVPAPLLSRCKVFFVDDYSFSEKKDICRKYIEQYNSHVYPSKVIMDERQIEKIVTINGSTQGVRSIEKTVESIFARLSSTLYKKNGAQLNVSDTVLETINNPPTIIHGYDLTPAPGQAPVLAVSGGQGVITPVEVSIYPGPFNVSATGMLMQMMGESIVIAASYIRDIVENQLSCSLGEVLVHLPYPIQKDGDSAGAAIAVAILSAHTGVAPAKNACITGSITLHGQILPVGGTLEKLMAAKKNGYSEIIFPNSQKEEIVELPESIRAGIQISYASNFMEACSIMLPEVHALLTRIPNTSKELENTK